MPQDSPYRSDDAYMKGVTPVQAFVDPPHEVTDEERNRPRNGRPQRKPQTPTAETPNATEEKS